MSHKDFLFRGDLAELDPDIAELVRHETARQARTLIMIPSESTIPQAVREAVGSSFSNIYAEGYPLDETRTMSQQEILDYAKRLPEYRRIADNRYYKGTEYANVLEALTRRRCAEVFATERYSADQLFVNVQPLSGAPANSAVYTALLKPGDTIMSMNLMFGGHLSHGAPVNRTGKTYKIVAYSIHPETEALDYEQMYALAQEHKPKILIGGYSSFPLAPDWHKYREIADSVGAILLADVAHFAGLVIAGEYPSPIGIADITTFTTHKTLGGPRGAVIITHRSDLATKLDRGVFPGEQGGPHMNQIAGLAVALRFATTEQFKELQRQTVANARRLAEKLAEHGLRIPYGGTDSHMLVVDLRTIKGKDGTALTGDMAARILDLIGVVCNRQTIPGDTSALRPSGIRLGTPWITQRGFGFAEIDELARIIAEVLFACQPYKYTDKPEGYAKIDFDVFQQARLAVRQLIDRVGIDTDATVDGYPHFSYIDDDYGAGWQTLRISGERATNFLNIALTSAVKALTDGATQPTHLLETDGRVMASGVVERIAAQEYRLHLNGNVARVAAWLRGLSDGFVLADCQDVHVRLPGPVAVVHEGAAVSHKIHDDEGYADKAYFIGMNGAHFARLGSATKPEFTWTETEEALKVTPLHGLHKQLGAKMAPFAGYDMPLWYDRVGAEHQAVRTHAGIFDVTHMGVWDVRGAGAEAFLNAITTNSVTALKVGHSHYTFFLDIHGIPFDDLMVYRLAAEHFFVVVNASNDAKNWACVNAVLQGAVLIDPHLPARRIPAQDVTLRDLRAASSGADRRVDVALQGPQSLAMLQKLGGSEADLAKVAKLPWAGITRATLGGYELIVSRTGYTGERIAFELFPHPDQAAALFAELVNLGVVPCGLAARDSLRIEAGLPLYGHELSGDLGLNPADAGMKSYVKLDKPFFVGKAAFSAREAQRAAEVVRFQLPKGSRMAHTGDPIVDERGRVVGLVTSCSVDGDGIPTGQAYVKQPYQKKDTKLAIFCGTGKAKATSLNGLQLGDKVVLPETLTVVSRFPEKK
jgi:glycine hydroxymethyltransferase